MATFDCRQEIIDRKTLFEPRRYEPTSLLAQLCLRVVLDVARPDLINFFR